MQTTLNSILILWNPAVTALKTMLPCFSSTREILIIVFNILVTNDPFAWDLTDFREKYNRVGMWV